MFDTSSNDYGSYFDRPLMPSSKHSSSKRASPKDRERKSKKASDSDKQRRDNNPTSSSQKQPVYKNYIFKKLRTKSENPNRMMDAVFVNAKTGKEKVVSFGKSGQCTFINTPDAAYKTWYRQEHSYTDEELMTPNALTNLILFNKSSIEDSLKDYKNKLRRAANTS